MPGLVAVGFAVGCSGSDSSNSGDCAVTHEQKTITTTEPAVDPGLQFKIDSCRADADACPTLCAMAMTQAGISFNNGGGVFNGQPLPPNAGPGGFNSAPVTPAINCDVTFQDGNVSMLVKYDVYTTTLGCPINVNTGDTTGVTGVPVPSGGPK